MKPVLLELEAFGAFAELQKIKFDVFEQNRLFLIHGPTGSGKTTIFDAMCFALYGETTGNRKGSNMRSDHVGKDQPTRISFIFQKGLYFYQAEREIKVTRGGNISQNQSFNEVIWDEHKGHYVSHGPPLTKVNEIKDKVKEILGFDAEQFKQIVILPQGKFQELLLSGTDKKEDILKQLFNAGIYEKITQQLLEDSKAFKKEIQEKSNRKQARLESVEQESLEMLDQLILALEEQIRQDQEKLPLLNQAYKETQQKFQSAKQLFDHFQEFEEAKIAQEKHQSQASQKERWEHQLTQAERAELLRGSIEEIDKLAKNIDIKTKAVQTTNSIIISKNEKLKKIQVKLLNLEDQKPEIESLKNQTNKLEELQPQFHKLDLLQNEIAQAETQNAQAQTQIQSFQTSIQNKTQEIEIVNQKKLDEQETLLREKMAIEQNMRQFETWREFRKERQEALQKYRQLKQTQDKVLLDFNEIGQKRKADSILYNQLEEKWRLSQSAHLAETLKNNEPCPVCGSLEHPAPAQKTDQYVSDEELNKAKEARDHSEKLYEESKTRVDHIKNEIKLITDRGQDIGKLLGEIKNLSDQDFESEFQNLSQKSKKAQAAEKLVTQIKKENEQLKSEIQAIQSQIDTETAQINNRQKRIFECQAEVKNLQQNLPENLKSEEELVKSIEQLKTQIHKFEQDLEHTQKEVSDLNIDIKKRETEVYKDEREIKNLESDLDDRERKLQRDLKAKNFQNTQEIRQALILEEERTYLKKQIEDWKTKNTQLQTRFQQAQKKIQNQEKPEIALLQTQLKQSEEDLLQQQSQIAKFNQKINDLKKQSEDIHTIEKDLIKLEEKANHVIDLAELANGKNDLNQKFQTYVLSVFLDDVVDYANQRLRILSQDRYQLQRSEEVLHGNRKAGLDLKVFDSYSGKERLVHNLSGGETFFTSLALALGLADVATANAGGIRLDAMFIDEGFGTLDSETLDLAIRTLMNLDGEYRLVGIISHVGELRERVPSSRLEVLKGRNGSKLKVHAV